jgi:hypothetical protein
MPRLAARCEALTEVAADASAVAGNSAGARGVASALLRFEPKPASGGIGIAPQRVDHLLGRSGDWESDIGRLGLALALAAVGGMGLVAFAAGSQAARLNVLELPAVICTLTLGLAIACACALVGRLARRHVNRSAASAPRWVSAGQRGKRGTFRRA